MYYFLELLHSILKPIYWQGRFKTKVFSWILNCSIMDEIITHSIIFLISVLMLFVICEWEILPLRPLWDKSYQSCKHLANSWDKVSYQSPPWPPSSVQLWSWVFKTILLPSLLGDRADKIPSSRPGGIKQHLQPLSSPTSLKHKTLMRVLRFL